MGAGGNRDLRTLLIGAHATNLLLFSHAGAEPVTQKDKQTAEAGPEPVAPKKDRESTHSNEGTRTAFWSTAWEKLLFTGQFVQALVGNLR